MAGKKRKTWIFFKVGLFRDPKHRREMGEGVWLYGHIVDTANWETGIRDEFKDQECADDMGASLSWVRKHRRRLEAKGYIKVEQQGTKGQRITIIKWVNPRGYGGEVMNEPEQSITDATPKPTTQSVAESGPQSVSQGSTPVILAQVQNEHAFNISIDHKDSVKPPSGKERKPNRIFDAVALGSFGIKDTQSINGQGGRVAKISNWLLKCEPVPTPERLKEFYDWYEREYSGVNAPRDLDKFTEHWQRFGQNDAPRSIGPRVTKLIDTEAA